MSGDHYYKSRVRLQPGRPEFPNARRFTMQTVRDLKFPNDIDKRKKQLGTQSSIRKSFGEQSSWRDDLIEAIIANRYR
jgi:hypothetical protein